FVAPPYAGVELERASFRVHPAAGSEQRRGPIDTFFRSLASAFGTRSVGIILSGAGGDGTAGVQQIAHEGGLTPVQRPEQARRDGMPRSAIATGVVDHVLAPAEMAVELFAHAAHLRELAADEGALQGYESVLQTLPEICDLLRKSSDHNFKHYKTS